MYHGENCMNASARGDSAPARCIWGCRRAAPRCRPLSSPLFIQLAKQVLLLSCYCMHGAWLSRRGLRNTIKCSEPLRVELGCCSMLAGEVQNTACAARQHPDPPTCRLALVRMPCTARQQGGSGGRAHYEYSTAQAPVSAAHAAAAALPPEAMHQVCATGHLPAIPASSPASLRPPGICARPVSAPFDSPAAAPLSAPARGQPCQITPGSSLGAPAAAEPPAAYFVGGARGSGRHSSARVADRSAARGSEGGPALQPHPAACLPPPPAVSPCRNPRVAAEAAGWPSGRTMTT